MPEEIPLDAYYDLTEPGEVALSPGGDRIAFVADEFDPDADARCASLFVVPADGSRDPHRLTRVAGAGSPRWGPDGDRLAFLAERETDLARRVGRDGAEDDGRTDANADGDGADAADAGAADDRKPDRQLWLFDLARGGDARQVTDREEGVQGFDWSPDGDRLVIEARDPTDGERSSLEARREGGPVETTRLQHKLDGAGWLDDVTRYLFVLDADGDAEPERLDDARGGGAFEPLRGMEPRWGAGGRIAFTACRLDRPDDTVVRDVYTIRPDGSDLAKLTESDLAASAPAWGPSGERLAFVGRDPENWCVPRQVYVHDGDGYASRTAALDRTVARGGRPRWADRTTLYALVGDEGRTRPVRIDAGSGDAGAERTFPAQGEFAALRSLDVAGGTAAFLRSHPREGVDVHAVDLDAFDGGDGDRPVRRLSALNDDLLDAHAMPDCRRIAYESGGREIGGVLYHPPDRDPEADGPLPLVVHPHGGPVSYDEPEFGFDHAALASRGYLVFQPNYRGGSSYGREFAETLYGQWGTVEVEDIVAGAEALFERGWADPERVFGHGFSYGGIAQGYLVTRTDLLTAAAPEHGIYDLRSAFGTDDSHIWTTNEFGVPWENGDAVDAASSIGDAGGIDTPLLVMAGGEDWRCAPSQSEQLYVSARKQGVDAKLVVYPDEHHDVGDPDRAIHRFEEIVAWYERHDPAVGSGDGD